MSKIILPVYGYCINPSCVCYNKKIKGARKANNNLNIFCPTCDNLLYMFKDTKNTKDKKEKICQK